MGRLTPAELSEIPAVSAAGLVVTEADDEGLLFAAVVPYLTWPQVDRAITGRTFRPAYTTALAAIREALGRTPATPAAVPTPTDVQAMAAAAAAHPRDTTAALAHADAVLDAGGLGGDPRSLLRSASDYHSRHVLPLVERLRAAETDPRTAHARESGAEWSPDTGLISRLREELAAARQQHLALLTAAGKAREAQPRPKARPKKKAAVTILGNTYPVRDRLARIPGARFDAGRRAWTVPAEHADEARRIVAEAPSQDTMAELLALSDAELAARGLVRTSGPRGPYVRRGAATELNDHY